MPKKPPRDKYGSPSIPTPRVRSGTNYGEASQRDTGPILIPKTPPPLGTTSRAYSLTHGAQQGLGLNENPLVTALSGNNGIANRGGSVIASPASTYAPLEADLSKNPYGPAYDQLLAFISNSAKARGPEYDAVAEQLKAYRAKADEGLHNSYIDNRKLTDQSATALGVDPNAISAERDYTNRRMQENSDQALADNLAWVQKAKLLQGDNISGYLAQAAQSKASSTAQWDAQEQQRIADLNTQNLQALAASSRASKSGGGSGKSGGASGSAKTTVTKTDTLANSGLDLDYYNYLVNSGQKDAAAVFLQQTYLNSGNPMVADTQKKINQAAQASNYSPVGHGFGDIVKNLGARATSAKSALQKQTLEQVLKGMLGYSGVLGNPKTSSVVKTVGKG